MRLTKEKEAEYRTDQGTAQMPNYEGFVLGMGNRLFEESNSILLPKDFLESLEIRSRKPTHTIFEGRAGEKKVLYVTSQLGGPCASYIIEKFLGHGPANNVVGVGFMGATQDNIKLGDIIIPEEAIVGEGTTPYYFPKNSRIPPVLRDGYKAKPSQKILEKLVKEANKENLTVHMGTIYTTDCYSMETPELINSLKKKGVLGVDMETSTLFSVSDFHEKPSAAILVVSDNQITNHSNCVGNVVTKGKALASENFQKSIKVATNALLNY